MGFREGARKGRLVIMLSINKLRGRSGRLPSVLILTMAFSGLLLYLGLSAEIQADTPDPRAELVNQIEVTMAQIKSVGLSMEAYKLDHGSYPGPPPKQPGLPSAQISVASIKEFLEPTYIRSLPTQDTWGNDLIFAQQNENLVVVSLGANGVEDGAPLLWGLDLVWFAGEFLHEELGRVIPKEATRYGQKRMARDHHAKALKSMRTIATCFESYAVDNNKYPGKTKSFQPVAKLRGELEPTYVANLPANDPWGSPVYYWSDGEDYRLVSGGANRELETTERSKVSGMAPESEMDLVYENGTFLQVPERMNRR